MLLEVWYRVVLIERRTQRRERVETVAAHETNSAHSTSGGTRWPRHVSLLGPYIERPCYRW